MRSSRPLALAAFAAVTFAAAALGALPMRRHPRKPWYRALRKPRHTPPDRVFGIVWPVLYGLDAYSGYRAWTHRRGTDVRPALVLWTAHLGLNAAWTPLFFGAHRARAALGDLVLQLGTLASYAAVVRRVDRRAAILVLPNLAWLVYAGTINAEVIRKNPRWLAG